MDKIKLALFIIIFLGTLIRFWSLGGNNLGLFRDEAALGFNSWSILQTGKDEYGQVFPSVFRSFEVFFMPAYVYFSVPIMALLGLSEFSTRFLSAFSGSFLILVAYLIARKIFSSGRVGVLSALVVAFSPWSIMFSRGAFEGNLALLFFAGGFYFWLKFLDKFAKIYFFISLLLFLLSMYSYQSPRLVIPLFLLISAFSLNNFLKLKKTWILGFLLMFFLYLPILSLAFQPASYHRVIGVSTFSRNNISVAEMPQEFAAMYLHYFSPLNLFWQGDYNNQRSVEGFSTFYFWLAPFLIFGIWKFVNGNFRKKPLFLLTLLGPLPAALTPDPFHTYRAILFFLPISLLIAFGVASFLDYYKRFKFGLSILLIAFFTVSLANYFFNYLYITPLYKWRDWDFGYKEIAAYLKDNDSFKVVIDDKNTESYVHLLFYQVMSINDYQEQAEKVIGQNYYSSSDELRPKKVGRFEFRKIDLHAEREEKNTIFILPSNQIHVVQFSADPNLKLDKIIKAPDENDAFYIIKTINGGL